MARAIAMRRFRVQDETLPRRTVVFVNVAHALDHFVLLVYPTAVIAIAAQLGIDYSNLIALATGAFVAFGLCSLPMGWLADRFGRRNMLAVFFFGYGASCMAIAACRSPAELMICLLVLGIFSAIYHPVGSSMLVSHASRLGRDLGWNGVWGNAGAALASAVTAFLAATLGWRWAFVLPGLVCILIGTAFVVLVTGDGTPSERSRSRHAALSTSRPIHLLIIFAIAIVAGGMTFNMTTIAMPKIIDEGIGFSLPLTMTGALATAVFTCGALTQLATGRLLDRYALPAIFVGLALLQPVGLSLAAIATGIPMLVGLLIITSAIYGQVVVNDAMVARYVPEGHRARAFSVRYFLGFTASGFAVPLISLLHRHGGFPTVLGVAAGFGAVVAISAIAFVVVEGASRLSTAPAE